MTGTSAGLKFAKYAKFRIDGAPEYTLVQLENGWDSTLPLESLGIHVMDSFIIPTDMDYQQCGVAYNGGGWWGNTEMCMSSSNLNAVHPVWGAVALKADVVTTQMYLKLPSRMLGNK